MGSFRKWIAPLVILVTLAPLIYLGINRHNRWKKEHMLIQLRPIQTPKGWGYDILMDGKVYIHQNIIPAIPGEHGFRTKEDALAVGQKVYERVVAGQMPMVSVQEVEELGIYPDSLKH
jgi:Domain of unknown function (DUF4907)